MDGDTKVVTEKLMVRVPFTSADQKTVKDPNGNQIVFPSLNARFNVTQFALSAIILDKSGKELCSIEQEAAHRISRPGLVDSVASIFTREYSVDAPIGSIPNLCKKDKGR